MAPDVNGPSSVILRVRPLIMDFAEDREDIPDNIVQQTWVKPLVESRNTLEIRHSLGDAIHELCFSYPS